MFSALSIAIAMIKPTAKQIIDIKVDQTLPNLFGSVFSDDEITKPSIMREINA